MMSVFIINQFCCFCIIYIKPVIRSKHASMLAMLRQCLSGADKAVQIRRAVFVDIWTQPELRYNKSEIILLIRISDLLYAWFF